MKKVKLYLLAASDMDIVPHFSNFSALLVGSFMFMLKLSEFFLTLMMVMTALTKQKVFTEIMIRIGTKKKIILDGRSWNNERLCYVHLIMGMVHGAPTHMAQWVVRC